MGGSGLGNELMDDDSSTPQDTTADTSTTSHNTNKHEDSCTESQKDETEVEQPSLNVPMQDDGMNNQQGALVNVTNLSDSTSHTTVQSVPDINTVKKNQRKESKK